MEPVIERPSLPLEQIGFVQSMTNICQQYGQRINRLLRGPYYPITADEVAAGVANIDELYPVGDARRYGEAVNDVFTFSVPSDFPTVNAAINFLSQNPTRSQQVRLVLESGFVMEEQV